MPTADERSRARPPWLFLLVLLALTAALEWSLDEPRSAQQPVSADEAPAAAAPVQHVDAHRPPPRKPAAPAAPACVPRTRKACHDGNVWWLDSCGQASEMEESCQGRGCEDERCTPDPQRLDHCGPINAYGTCVGDVAKACVAHEIVAIDCRKRDERCVMTSEGAQCLARDDVNGCSERDQPSCVDDRLHLCVDGLWRNIDCAARRASCSELGNRAHCAALDREHSKLPPLELCDRRDNDRDGRVDEGGACDPVALVAFVPSSAPPDLAARMTDELAHLNQILAPMVFQWSRVVTIDDSYQDFSPEHIEAAAQHFALDQSVAEAPSDQRGASATQGTGLSFYVPVLYVQHLQMTPPKAAISTLPNSRCGGVRISDAPAPPTGLIVLSESRQPETLAHEMGHYLGLCHTHEDLGRFAVTTRSEDACSFTGDGVCDTPLDPGPESCVLQDQCVAMCTVLGASPSTSNVMSYYLGCRTQLSDDQLEEAERNLALRRGWFRCLDPDDCPCEPGVANACPAEMSCQPGGHAAGSWRCGLDGASLPGTPCRSGGQCAESSFCLQTESKAGTASRCVRACQDGDDACTCTDIGLPFRVCAEDLDPGLEANPPRKARALGR